jgi:hypothetical protein
VPISGSALLVSTSTTSTNLEESTKAGQINDTTNNPSEDDNRNKWDLFWILHVVWENGIAQRRGVGQVLESSLESASSREVKTVLLG